MCINNDNLCKNNYNLCRNIIFVKMYMYIRKIPVNIIIVSKKNFTCKCETYIHLKVLLVQVQVQVGQNWWFLKLYLWYL